jgi:anti-anti-sigma factor
MLTFNYNTEEKITTFAFTGRMDTQAVVSLNEIIGAEEGLKDLKPEDKIVFDLKDVDYIASSFIRICVIYAKQASADCFSITNCQPFVKKTFKISGLDEVLNIR